MAEPLIGSELEEFLTGGQSVIVATRDAALTPRAVRACGLRVLPGDRLQLLLPRATAERSLEDLRDCGDVAVVVASPRTYRSVQLKGRFLSVADASPEDVIASQEHLRAFSEAVVGHGMTRQHARNMWMFDCWRVEVQVTSVFVQTPGPGAGRKLERS